MKNSAQQAFNLADIPPADQAGFIKAAMKGEKDTVLKFLDKYGDALFEVKGDTGASGFQTALGMAARFGQLEIIELLLERGFPLNERSKGGRSVIYHANMDAVKLLVEKGIDINAQDKNGWTALMCEAINGDLDRVKSLIDLGAAIDLTSDEGRTAESHARGVGQLHVSDFLKELELQHEIADLLSHPQQDNTSLPPKTPDDPSEDEIRNFIMACNYGENADVAAFLDKYPHAVDQDHEHGETGLIVAAFKSKKNTVALLLERGANINAADAAGWTALRWATFDKEMVALLLENGANPNLKSLSGCTPLMDAAANGYEESLMLLLQSGANINEETPDGKTALMMAEIQKQVQTAELLEKWMAFTPGLKRNMRAPNPIRLAPK